MTTDHTLRLSNEALIAAVLGEHAPSSLSLSGRWQCKCGEAGVDAAYAGTERAAHRTHVAAEVAKALAARVQPALDAARAVAALHDTTYSGHWCPTEHAQHRFAEGDTCPTAALTARALGQGGEG